MIVWLRRLLRRPKPSPDPMADGIRNAYLLRLARERAIADALNKALYGHSGDARPD